MSNKTGKIGQTGVSYKQYNFKLIMVEYLSFPNLI